MSVFFRVDECGLILPYSDDKGIQYTYDGSEITQDVIRGLLQLYLLMQQLDLDLTRRLDGLESRLQRLEKHVALPLDSTGSSEPTANVRRIYNDDVDMMKGGAQ